MHRHTVHAEHFFVTVFLFIFAYAFSHWLKARESSNANDYAAVLSLWTLRFALFTMLVLSFEQPWRELVDSDWDHQASMWAIVIVLLGITLWFGWWTEKLQTIVPISVFCCLSMIVVTLSGSPDDGIYFQVVYNIALIGSAIWLIFRGIRRGISHYFFLGVATILLTALLRYIDLIGDYVGGAILFMILAVLLLAAARYWKGYQQQGALS